MNENQWSREVLSQTKPAVVDEGLVRRLHGNEEGFRYLGIAAPPGYRWPGYQLYQIDNIWGVTVLTPVHEANGSLEPSVECMHPEDVLRYQGSLYQLFKMNDLPTEAVRAKGTVDYTIRDDPNHEIIIDPKNIFRRSDLK